MKELERLVQQRKINDTTFKRVKDEIRHSLREETGNYLEDYSLYNPELLLFHNKRTCPILKRLEEMSVLVKQAKNLVAPNEIITKKFKDWNWFLNIVVKRHGCSISNHLEEKIFSKCSILSFDEGNNFNSFTFYAKIKIGNVVITHFAHDEIDDEYFCETNISLHFETDDTHTLFAESNLDDRGNLDIVLLPASKKLRELLELSDDISDELLVSSLMVALPWKPSDACVFFCNVIKEQ